MNIYELPKVVERSAERKRGEVRGQRRKSKSPDLSRDPVYTERVQLLCRRIMFPLAKRHYGAAFRALEEFVRDERSARKGR